MLDTKVWVHNRIGNKLLLLLMHAQKTYQSDPKRD
jgi:hypothetical protein